MVGKGQYPAILRVAVETPLRQTFDYLPLDFASIENLLPGVRVQIPFGRRQAIGILLAVVTESRVLHHQLKPIIAVLDTEPLIPPALLTLGQWASDYYHYPIGEVLVGTLPKLLRQGKATVVTTLPFEKKPQEPPIVLNTHQQHAVDVITRHRGFQVYLLSGVTGSGKTEVYLQSIDAMLKAHQQVLVLVPEIALTPQTVTRFERRFQVPIVLLHSHLSDLVREQAWLSALHHHASIIIGTRSAIFTPMAHSGMIILDEEHDPSFKQQSGFRYSARDLAVMRARIENVPVILGSATPSLESLYNVKRKRYQLLSLPERAGDAVMPVVHTMDLRRQPLTAGMSNALWAAMTNHLERGRQVLLFLNRRGYASTVMCHQCGWVVLCAHCDARLTLHQTPRRLYCHHCGFSQSLPSICPKCRQSELIDLGLGTEQLEAVLKKRFPQYPLVRIDRDSTRAKDSMKNKLALIHNKTARILVGTQMLAKGHHFPHLTLAAIVNADSGLYGVDFRTLERMAQLLIQVMGRSGREQPGEVIIQTHHPEHPLLRVLLQEGYDAFAQALLAERKIAELPPYAHWVLLRAEGKQLSLALQFLRDVKQSLMDHHGVTVLGPVPAPMERRAGRYRSQLLLQTNQRFLLQALLKTLVDTWDRLDSARRVRWSLDTDP